ncbi:MAG: ATP-grasp domain-containing protein [Acidobacteriota bacterium]
MHILYPADYFKPKRVDADFHPEAEAFRELGLRVLAVPFDEDGPRAIRSDLSGAVLYRGWMLNGQGYGGLVSRIKAAGGSPLTTEEDYLLTHHIPRWAPLLKELTPETVVLPNGSDFETELRKLGWKEFFVKDYVKSLKVSMGSRISDPGMIGPLVEEMRKFRGTIEGGLCVRRVEALRPDTERRYFVLKGEAYAPDGGAVPDLVKACAERLGSPFFSVDIANREDGELRVVEVGDGQVSDTVGWETEAFVQIFRGLASA